LRKKALFWIENPILGVDIVPGGGEGGGGGIGGFWRFMGVIGFL
jgi:hypothetical protein